MDLTTYLSVSELLGRYPHAVDAGSPDDVAALFGDDGTLVVHGGRRYEGRAPIVTFLEASRASRAAAGSALRHHISSIDVAVQTDVSATAQSYFLAVGRNGPDHWGTYRDRLACVDGAWFFEERQVTIEGADPEGWIGSGAAPVSLES